ncbi:hypothetical protein [Streptomyces sp. NPDC090445]|uniref:hypothetical protein n=1 Tax=Streptomyces sp. NPDC090445 TaxID=3365963 RepID=UPI0037F719AB
MAVTWTGTQRTCPGRERTRWVSLDLAKIPLPCGGSHDGAVPGYYSQTLVTQDGRHASAVTNAYLVTNIPAAQMHKMTLTAARCEPQS